jgi:hypothetical protein
MNIIEEVKKINLPKDKYVVFGSGILAAKGIRPAKDVDFAVTSDLFRQLQRAGWKRKFFFIRFLSCKLITTGIYEAFSNVRRGKYQKSVEELIESAEVIEGIPFMNLEELRAFKQELGRPKDLNDIQLIDDYLRIHK